MASRTDLKRWIDKAIEKTPVYDLHTHLYPPSFADLMLWGFDELVTYHYLIAEAIRASGLAPDRFWAMDKPRQAEFIWQTLFVERAPVSEACRGVLTVLDRLGLDVSKKDLRGIRKFFAAQKADKYVDTVFKLANVHTVVMTNDALDPVERGLWLKGVDVDPRFKAVLRIDPLLLGFPSVADRLRGFGYNVSADLDASSLAEIRRFLLEWIDRMKALYVAVSLSPDWRYPDDSATTKVIRECVLPVAREKNVPFAMMIGVVRQANARLKLAGDAVGKSDVRSVDAICAQNPDNPFMVTMLARENQHELAVSARKHANLLLFGCWWFLNNPSLIEEMTRMRMELLGTSFVPQHSDARVLDQIIYKWDHSRAVIAKVLREKFTDLSAAGWPVTKQEIQKTVEGYLSGNFQRLVS